MGTYFYKLMNYVDLVAFFDGGWSFCSFYRITIYYYSISIFMISIKMLRLANHNNKLKFFYGWVFLNDNRWKLSSYKIDFYEKKD